MNNTIYSATTGLLTRQKSMNITSNNLSNMETTGFKRSEVVSRTFGEYITAKIDENAKIIGNKTHGVISDNVYTNFEQGPITSTGRNLDLALNGHGFFTLTDADGNTMLTRDGRFTVDDNGFLTDKSGNFVMGINGRINVGNEDFIISDQGAVLKDETVLDTLNITVPQDTSEIYMLSNGLLSYPEGELNEFTGLVLQGSLEKANVDLVEEMTAMIEDSRAFQTCSQLVRIADGLMQKTVTEIGRV